MDEVGEPTPVLISRDGGKAASDRPEGRKASDDSLKTLKSPLAKASFKRRWWSRLNPRMHPTGVRTLTLLPFSTGYAFHCRVFEVHFLSTAVCIVSSTLPRRCVNKRSRNPVLVPGSLQMVSWLGCVPLEVRPSVSIASLMVSNLCARNSSTPHFPAVSTIQSRIEKD